MNKPPSRPQLSRTNLEHLIAGKLSADYRVVLVGIRGYYQDSMGEKGKNDRGIYDDAIFVVAPDYFTSYNGNTDPSVARKGISVLKPGVHLYRKGKHKIASPNGYAAFRPANAREALPVTRDGIGDSEGIAINIHKGSYGSTSSEGCQTIYPDQWKEFQESVYKLMDQYKQTIIPYILIEQT